jgi:hypothetical protein
MKNIAPPRSQPMLAEGEIKDYGNADCDRGEAKIAAQMAVVLSRNPEQRHAAKDCAGKHQDNDKVRHERHGRSLTEAPQSSQRPDPQCFTARA